MTKTYQDIEDELVVEYENLLKLDKYTTKPAEGMDKLTAVSDHMAKSDDFYKELVDKLNEVLMRHEIEFRSEQEKTDFSNFIKPTMQKYMTNFLKN